MIQLHKSGKEILTAIPVNGGPQCLWTVGSLQVPMGAVVNVQVQCEVTNPYPFNVGIGRGIYSECGGWIAPQCMSNVTPDEHHKVIIQQAVERIPSDRWAFWQFYIWAVAENQSGSIVIEPGYGVMTVQIQ